MRLPSSKTVTGPLSKIGIMWWSTAIDKHAALRCARKISAAAIAVVDGLWWQCWLLWRTSQNNKVALPFDGDINKALFINILRFFSGGYQDPLCAKGLCNQVPANK